MRKFFQNFRIKRASFSGFLVKIGFVQVFFKGMLVFEVKTVVGGLICGVWAE
ncbi:hypothetical protein ES703_85929 [subsurface metagenome]